jgi:hypothetical protein
MVLLISYSRLEQKFQPVRDRLKSLVLIRLESYGSLDNKAVELTTA